MKTILPLLLFYCFTIHSFAQTTLKAMLDEYQTASGEKKAQMYPNIAREYFLLRDYKTATQYAEKGIQEGLGYQKYKVVAECATLLGEIHTANNENEQALKAFIQAISAYEKLNPPTVPSSLYEKMGDLYFQWKVYPKAISYYEKAIAGSSTIEKAELAENIAICYLQQKNYTQANRFFETALQQFKSSQSSKKAISILNQLASLAFLNKLSPKAIEYYQQIIDLAKKSSDWTAQA
ncbi:MAG: tetratricopeptide repeat protein, partial [Bacteroidia bacterium]|nr:tetratricopeptide repeat protein [Bacteroidia bacterium]